MSNSVYIIIILKYKCLRLNENRNQIKACKAIIIADTKVSVDLDLVYTKCYTLSSLCCWHGSVTRQLEVKSGL